MRAGTRSRAASNIPTTPPPPTRTTATATAWGRYGNGEYHANDANDRNRRPMPQAGIDAASCRVGGVFICLRLAKLLLQTLHAAEQVDLVPRSFTFDPGCNVHRQTRTATLRGSRHGTVGNQPAGAHVVRHPRSGRLRRCLENAGTRTTSRMPTEPATSRNVVAGLRNAPVDTRSRNVRLDDRPYRILRSPSGSHDDRGDDPPSTTKSTTTGGGDYPGDNPEALKPRGRRARGRCPTHRAADQSSRTATARTDCQARSGARTRPGSAWLRRIFGAAVLASSRSRRHSWQR